MCVHYEFLFHSFLDFDSSVVGGFSFPEKIEADMSVQKLYQSHCLYPILVAVFDFLPQGTKGNLQFDESDSPDLVTHSNTFLKGSLSQTGS